MASLTMPSRLRRAVRFVVRATIPTLWLSWAAGTPASASEKVNPDFAAQQQSLFQQMQREPANLNVILAYAEVSAKLGDNEAAVSALQRMLLFNPNLLSVNLELGALYFRMGSFAMAQAYLEKAAAANPPPEIRARIDQYLTRIAFEDSPSKLTGSLLLGLQYQSDANVATASPLINSPVGPLLLSNEFVKKADGDIFLAGSALYSYDLGTANRDTFEVTGTGFLQHYFQVQRLDLDFAELTVGPRFQVPDLGISGVQSASLKPYAIVNEVGLGENQYFYTYGSGAEATARLWGDLSAKVNFEFRHKTFSNAPDRPFSTGLDGDDKLVSLALAKPITDNSVLTTGFDFLDQSTNLAYYSNKSYAVSAAYRVRYDDPTHWIGLPWETTVWGSRLWSFYGAPDPCCNTSSTPFMVDESDQRTRHWRFGVTQIVQVSDDLGIFAQFGRDIVSSNLPFYAYTSNSVLIGPQFRFAAAPTLPLDNSAANPLRDPTDGVGQHSVMAFRLEGVAGGTFGSNTAKAALATKSVSINTNDVTFTGAGFTGGVALWADGPLAAWTGDPFLNNFSFGLEYRHLSDSESANVTATILPSGDFLGGTIGGRATANFDSDNLMVDAAWRLNSGVLHPYTGAGVGVALVDWEARLNAPILALVGSPTSFSSGILTAVTAVHLFAGLDYDLTPQVYVGAGADYYFTDTAAKHFTHTSVDLNANQFSLAARVGYRF